MLYITVGSFRFLFDSLSLPQQKWDLLSLVTAATAPVVNGMRLVPETLEWLGTLLGGEAKADLC